MFVLEFIYVALFWNEDDSKAKFRTFSFPVKLRQD